MDPQLQPQTTNSEAQPPVTAPVRLTLPTTWPGGFGAYKYSKQAVKLNLGNIVLFGALALIVNIGLDIVLKRPGQIFGYIIGPLFQAVLVYLYICGVRNKEVSADEAFSRGVKVWLRMFLLGVLTGLTALVSFLLLIIPAFFVVPRLVLAGYFLLDQNMGVVQAYKASWHATKGHVGKVYGILGAGIAMALLMITIIGIPFAIYFLIMYSAAYAVLYEFILRQSAPTDPVVS